MLRIFTDTNEFFGYGYLSTTTKREYILHVLDLDKNSRKHYIKIDYCEYKQLVDLKEGEGKQLLYGIYHDSYILKFFINEKYIKGEEKYVSEILQDGKSHYCNYKGEVVE